jgi:predicted unusual protein kinase regulating ubiquinone biosynthesis (AarF/ABC1/UbiB family)
MNEAEVVVKVQYLEVEEFFKHDLAYIKILCKLLGFDVDKIMEEFTKSFVSEFDYREEAINMRSCSDNMKVLK